MSALQDRFRALMGTDLDINEHLGLLKGLASDDRVNTVIEFGFRTGVSATALCASGKQVISYDVERCHPHVGVLRGMAPEFEFRRLSSLARPIPRCGLLHIDSVHTYMQLKSELMTQSVKVGLWIAIHDTVTFGQKGQDGSLPGLQAAMNDFLKQSDQWKVRLHLQNNNGFTLLERSTLP